MVFRLKVFVIKVPLVFQVYIINVATECIYLIIRRV